MGILGDYLPRLIGQEFTFPMFSTNKCIMKPIIQITLLRDATSTLSASANSLINRKAVLKSGKLIMYSKQHNNSTIRAQ